MPVKNTTLGPGMLFLDDKLIGTAIEIDEIDTTPPEFYEEAPTFKLSNDIEFSLNAALNIPLIKELSKTEPQPFYMAHEGTRLEQIRKHKKKRINKKWAKRYGYREVPCRYIYEHCYISPESFNDFTINCNRIRMEDI